MTRQPHPGTESDLAGAPLPAHEPSHIHITRPSRRRALADRPAGPPADCCPSPEERADLSDR